VSLADPANPSATEYPIEPRGRDAWVLARRPPRTAEHNVFRPHGFFNEQERTDAGAVAWFATVFLTNRECPWRCVMCDLWKTTVTEVVPFGAIPAQIDHALEQLRLPNQQSHAGIKLYNGGSFFDPKAVPPDDYAAIAERAGLFERVVVECHPAFVNARCLQFRDLLIAPAQNNHRGHAQLEVAIGLETAHESTLEKLNKRMTLQDFERAARFLRDNGIALRVFVLVKPPFQDEAMALAWAGRSVQFAFDHGATAVSLIPTRAGNGAMEALAAAGQFTPPKLATLEAALAEGIRLERGRVFADLWDLERFSSCATCFGARQQRLQEMNLGQVVPPDVPCPHCGGTCQPSESNR
jgi:archaeosine synthase beta-subunit